MTAPLPPEPPEDAELTSVSDPDNVQFFVVEEDEEAGLSDEEVRRILEGEPPNGVTAASNVDSTTGEVHEGAMIALIPAAEDAQRLTVDGGEPTDQLHVTMAYLGDAVDYDEDTRRNIIDAMRAVAAEVPPFSADAFSVNVFNPTKEDVETAIVLGVGGSELNSLHESVWHELQYGDIGTEIAENHSPWVAHLTVNYTEDIDVDEYVELTGPVKFSWLRVAFGGEIIDLPLEGSDDDGEMVEKFQSRMPGKLKRYWLSGPGAAKIRWGTPGDFTRCVRLLKRHFPRATEGLCANLHHEATGKWPGDRRGRTRGDTITASAECGECGENVVASPPGTVDPNEGGAVSEVTLDTATGQDLQSDECPPGHHMMPDGECMPDEDMEAATLDITSGAFWEGPLVFEGETTGDGREFVPGSLTWAETPLPLRRNIEDSHGGMPMTKAVLVGRIDEIWRDGNTIMGRGVMDAEGEHGAEALRLMKENMVSGVSIDADDITHADVELVFPKDAPKDAELTPEKTLFHAGRIRAATLCDTPAFVNAKLKLIDASDEALAAAVEAYTEKLAARKEALAAAASVTELNDVRPPREWFQNPKLSVPTPITVTDTGRVYGHAAEWGTCHVGFGDTCVTPPYEDDHPYFMTGEVVCADGSRVSVGQVTLGTGHASLSLGASRAVEHYDNTGVAVADVVVGNDEHGVWVAGAVRPGTAPARIRELRASGQVSGDWRRVGGQLRLVGLLAVNVPGFPVPRLQTRVASGAQQALVAAGRSSVAHVPDADEEAELNRRALRLMADKLAESIGRGRSSIKE